jgi:hypothetical protein
MKQIIPLGLIEYETTTPVPEQVIELTTFAGKREIIWIESVNDREMVVHRRQANTDVVNLGQVRSTTLMGYALKDAFPYKYLKTPIETGEFTLTMPEFTLEPLDYCPEPYDPDDYEDWPAEFSTDLPDYSGVD